MDKSLAVRLRDEAGRLPAGPARRYPPKLKANVVRYVSERIDAGSSLSTVARELGIPFITLRQWLSERAEFRPIVVGGPAPELVLHAPHGIRVAGLDLESLADLLRRLS